MRLSRAMMVVCSTLLFACGGSSDSDSSPQTSAGGVSFWAGQEGAPGIMLTNNISGRDHTKDIDTPAYVTGVVSYKGSIWVGQKDDKIVKIDLTTEKVVDTIETPDHASDIVADDNGIWAIATGPDAHVVRYDPVTKKAVKSFPCGHSYCSSLHSGLGAVWVLCSADFHILKIDPATNSVQSISLVADNKYGIGSMAVGDTKVYAHDTYNHKFLTIDPITLAVSSVPIEKEALNGSMIFAEGRIIIAHNATHEFLSVDPANLADVKRLEVDGSTDFFTYVKGSLLLGATPSGTLYTVNPLTMKVLQKTPGAHVSWLAIP